MSRRTLKPPAHAHMLTHRGETLMLRQWAKRLNIAETTLRWRLDHGWPVAAALETAPIVEPLRGTDGVFVSSVEPDDAVCFRPHKGAR